MRFNSWEWNFLLNEALPTVIFFAMLFGMMKLMENIRRKK